jgi:hypothetical protein
MKIKVVDGLITGVYSEQVVSALRKAGLSLAFDRLSVIEPVADGAGFQIVWRNQRIIDALSATVTTDNGSPFATYADAVKKELELVNSILMS